MGKKIVFCILMLHTAAAYSQLNYIENGKKALYWGISLGVNSSNFTVNRKSIASANDTILSASSSAGPGFNLGLIGNWQFNEHFDLRIVPSMVFSEKTVSYQTVDRQYDNIINSTYLTLPLLVRYKSVPLKDLRVFLLGGLKYEYNIKSQERTLAYPNVIPLEKNGFSFEYGIGIQYFFPYFIFSPEIKFSHSINNLLGPNQSPTNSSFIEGLYPKALTISINFEG